MQQNGNGNSTDLRRYRGLIDRAQRAMQQNQTVAQMPFYLEACIGREAELQAIEN